MLKFCFRLMSAQQAASSARRERDAIREKLGGEVKLLRSALDEKTEALEIARNEMAAAVEKARQRQRDEDKGMVEEEWQAARMAIDDDSRLCRELEDRNAHLLEALSQALAEVDERAREMEVMRSAMKTAEEVRKCSLNRCKLNPTLFTIHSIHPILCTLYIPYQTRKPFSLV